MASKRILLADQSPEVQEAVTSLAARFDYEIVRATSGASVRSIASQTKLDLIVLDVVLTDGDGRDVLADLKRDARTSEIPVLVWAARDHESDRRISLALGAEDYLEKSDAQRLLSKIQRLLFRLDEG